MLAERSRSCGTRRLSAESPLQRAHNASVGVFSLALRPCVLREIREGEVRRILIPRNQVNKGKKEGRGATPRPLLRHYLRIRASPR